MRRNNTQDTAVAYPGKTSLTNQCQSMFPIEGVSAFLTPEKYALMPKSKRLASHGCDMIRYKSLTWTQKLSVISLI